MPREGLARNGAAIEEYLLARTWRVERRHLNLDIDPRPQVGGRAVNRADHIVRSDPVRLCVVVRPLKVLDRMFVGRFQRAGLGVGVGQDITEELKPVHPTDGAAGLALAQRKSEQARSGLVGCVHPENHRVRSRDRVNGIPSFSSRMVIPLGRRASHYATKTILHRIVTSRP